MLNKKADAKYLSIYWFVILVLVVVAIVFTVASFYSQSYDVRKIESNILINNVAECFSDNGKLRVSPEELDVNNCNLNFDDKNYNEEQYFVETKVYNLESCDPSSGECYNGIVSSSKGNVNYKSFCGKSGRKLPVCVNRKFYSWDEVSGKGIIVDVLAIVNKPDQNAKK